MSKRRSRNVPEDEKVKLTSEESKQQLRFLLGFLKPHRAKLIITLLVLTLSSGITVFFPKLLGDLIDYVLHPTPGSLPLLTIAMIVVGVLLAQSVTRYFTSTTLATISENTLASLRETLYRRIIHLPMSFFAERRVGELTSRLTSDLALIQETFTFTFLELLRQTIILAGGIIFISRMNYKLTGMVLLIIPVLVVSGLLFGRYIRRYSTRTQDALADASIVLEESLQAVSSVKSYVNENYEVNRYATAIRRGIAIAIKGARLRSAFVSFIIFALFSGIAAMIWYGGTLVRAGEITIGDLIAFAMYAMFVGGALGSFAEQFGQIQRTLGASVRVQQLLQEQPEEIVSASTDRTFSSVEVRDMTFSYPGRKDIAALHQVSLDIASGERVAFVGESGAGKSTMAALIQRFYEPDSGTILFDGIDARKLGKAAVRNSVGIVPQDIVLFGGTIAENIRYGRLEATDEEVRNAAVLANAMEFITNFPEQFETVVGERGVKLSGGQRQRIAIARAILKNSPILILDEATSSLDSQTEALIQEAMERLMQDRTTIIIAHRLSTIRKCDKIFVFSKGHIVETGTHAELLSHPDSMYAKLCALQFGDVEIKKAESV